MEMEILRVLDDKQLNGCDRFIHHTSGTLTLLQCDRAALQASSPTGVRLMADRDARAVNAHTPGQPMKFFVLVEADDLLFHCCSQWTAYQLSPE